jgi:hypothetical protein
MDGDACGSLQAAPCLRQRTGQRGDAMIPVVLTGTRGRNIESAHGHRAASATPICAQISTPRADSRECVAGT